MSFEDDDGVGEALDKMTKQQEGMQREMLKMQEQTLEQSMRDRENINKLLQENKADRLIDLPKNLPIPSPRILCAHSQKSIDEKN